MTPVPNAAAAARQVVPHRRQPAVRDRLVDVAATTPHVASGQMRQTAGGGRAPRLVLVPGGQAGGAAFVREEPVNAVDDSVTGLVRAWSAGDAMAGDRLFSRVYGELRAIARRLHRDPGNAGDPTLDTTALVHEVYLRMAGSDALEVVDRAHFFAVAVRASRQVLSNYVRDAQALKRGGVAVPMPLEGVAEHELAAADHETARIERAAMLEEALTALEALHPRPCRVVECRYFGGLSIPETALALDISEATVKRDWVVAQAWLHRALRDSPPRDDDAR